MKDQLIVSVFDDKWEIKYQEQYTYGKDLLIAGYPYGNKLINCYCLPFMFYIKVVNKLLAISRIYRYKPTNNLLWNFSNIFVPVAKTPSLKFLKKIGDKALEVIKKVDHDIFGSNFKWYNM